MKSPRGPKLHELTHADVPKRLVVLTHELNMLLRHAEALGWRVSVETVDRDGWTEVLVQAKDGGGM